MVVLLEMSQTPWKEEKEDRLHHHRVRIHILSLHPGWYGAVGEVRAIAIRRRTPSWQLYRHRN